MKQPVLLDVELAGPKVLLRPIAIADADQSFALVHRRRGVTDWLVWDGPESREELVRRYESWVDARATGVNYQLAVVERASGDFCGSFGLRFADHPFEGDLGYWIGEPYWAAGIGSEALALVARLAFSHLRARRLFAQVFEGNHPSERILVKNGFREDTAGRDAVPKGQELRARRYFELTRAEWSARVPAAPTEVERVTLREA